MWSFGTAEDHAIVAVCTTATTCNAAMDAARQQQYYTQRYLLTCVVLRTCGSTPRELYGCCLTCFVVRTCSNRAANDEGRLERCLLLPAASIRMWGWHGLVAFECGACNPECCTPLLPVRLMNVSDDSDLLHVGRRQCGRVYTLA